MDDEDIENTFIVSGVGLSKSLTLPISKLVTIIFIVGGGEWGGGGYILSLYSVSGNYG